MANIKNANSSELSKAKNSVIGLMTEWEKDKKKFTRSSDSDYGGTMRLGSYPTQIEKGSLVHKIYKSQNIKERHRHRYEVNINFKKELEKSGLRFTGMSPDGLLTEIIELKNHPWFVGVQFHPELKSRPFNPHPLFASFVKASMNNKN
jgi:CTP synthase